MGKTKNARTLVLASGGSGGFSYSYIWGYNDNKFNKLFDASMFDKMFEYQVNYLDNYKVEIINATLKKKFVLDINYKVNNI